ncbi:hypothetical protein HHL11_18355 [Ramlibacter sp. G-1-2-2]|uniref:SCP2 domain-containing protein n=1 Tax=Ramlibacter agri TaxID=2728837 RepID=A0A848H5D7_9BURK|nr:hypothetical protein [Ramlibacter agri]NML45717.1 hypothetical protein [Ramlibacter agri]
MNAFPELPWFRAYAAALEKDADFRANCRWFRGRVAFRVDGQACTVAFDDGMVTGVEEGMQGAEYVLSAPRSCWDRLLHADITLLRLYRAGELDIRGRNTEIMKNWKALFWIAEGMKLVAGSGRKD